MSRLKELKSLLQLYRVEGLGSRQLSDWAGVAREELVSDGHDSTCRN